ncbi:cation transporter [Methanoculleus taiwanensis]|uniref:Cation transporter n=1 Tax=Methanoculleus taiwanensis TaxID=1550565 RepID=A0A498H158_9EURY|nr:cation transporter [Methanoculleus taiwanensis]
MRYRQLAIIASDIGQLFLFIGLFACLPLLVGFWYDEAACLLPMASVPFVFMLLGLFLASVPQAEGEVRISVALSAVALIWLAAALIGALPFTLGLGMPYTDAVFEAMSGWTSTGLSMIVSVDAVPHTLLFWRSLMQWVGGLGIVAFTVAMAGRSGLTRFRLYRSEGRSETFLPSVVATGMQMWKIYVVLTLLGTGLVLVSGIPLWDAVNIAMTAISTGGFSVHSTGILYYDSPLLEMLVIPIMLAGALPFKLYYLLAHRRRFGILDDQQALLLFGLTLLGCAVVTYDLVAFSGIPPLPALRQGIFMVVSGITCTGFQNANPFEWPGVTVIFLAALMLVGGSTGSTAGGIKLARIILAGETLRWWFRRLFIGWRGRVSLQHDGKPIQEHLAEYEVSKNLLIAILFMLVVMIATLLLLHTWPAAGYDSGDVIFEVVSAISNVGISTGYASPAMSTAAKWLFIIVMWAGRLEIVPVIALVMMIGAQVPPGREHEDATGRWSE